MSADLPVVFLVEDEETFIEALEIGLKREGFRVHVARDGAEALSMFEGVKADIVLLDVMLPKISGTDVCREIRKKSQVPIIMVSAKGSEIDTVVGLEVGADDYILMANAGRVLTRETLIDRVWGTDYYGDTKTLDVHIKRLRSKVELDPAMPTRVATIRGLGYKYEKVVA